jgi:hypothetical protein
MTAAAASVAAREAALVEVVVSPGEAASWGDLFPALADVLAEDLFPDAGRSTIVTICAPPARPGSPIIRAIELPGAGSATETAEQHAEAAVLVA